MLFQIAQKGLPTGDGMLGSFLTSIILSFLHLPTSRSLLDIFQAGVSNPYRVSPRVRYVTLSDFSVGFPQVHNFHEINTARPQKSVT